jgi:uncharacterized protein YvpB
MDREHGNTSEETARQSLDVGLRHQATPLYMPKTCGVVKTDQATVQNITKVTRTMDEWNHLLLQDAVGLSHNTYLFQRQPVRCVSQ